MSTLDLLRAEIAAQLAEEARPPFESVNEIRSFIESIKPAPTENITLDLCFLGSKEYDRFWHAFLINRKDEQVFDAVAEMINGVDPARRSKYMFVLTIWKNRDESLNVIRFREGFCYRFAKVHSLKLVYGNPVGSIQIRNRLEAVPIAPVGFEQTTAREEQALTQSATAALFPPDAGTLSTPSHGGALKRTPPREEEKESDPPPPDKTPAKRRSRRCDAKADDPIVENEKKTDGPLKKIRKTCAKELVFASPTKTNSDT